MTERIKMVLKTENRPILYGHDKKEIIDRMKKDNHM